MLGTPASGYYQYTEAKTPCFGVHGTAHSSPTVQPKVSDLQDGNPRGLQSLPAEQGNQYSSQPWKCSFDKLQSSQRMEEMAVLNFTSSYKSSSTLWMDPINQKDYYQQSVNRMEALHKLPLG